MSVSRRLDQIEQTALLVLPTDVGNWAVASGNPSAADAVVIAPADLHWLLTMVRATHVTPPAEGDAGYECSCEPGLSGGCEARRRGTPELCSARSTGAIVPERKRCICPDTCLDHCRACNHSGRDLEEMCIADPDWEPDDDDLERRRDARYTAPRQKEHDMPETITSDLTYVSIESVLNAHAGTTTGPDKEHVWCRPECGWVGHDWVQHRAHVAAALAAASVRPDADAAYQEALSRLLLAHASEPYEYQTNQTYCPASDRPTDQCDVCTILLSIGIGR